MRIVELRHQGQRPFVLDLHPQLTLLTGLGTAGRRWLADALAGALRGELRDVEGRIDVHGVERALTEAAVAELALPADVDVVVRGVDLPGARAGTINIDLSDGDADGDTARLRTVASELSEARVARDRAVRARQDVERLLSAAREALVPGADGVADAELALEAARARRADVAARVEALLHALPDDGARADVVTRNELHERRLELDRDRARILGALDALPVVEPGPVAAALAAVRAWQPPEDQPLPEALEIADALEVVRTELELLPHPPSPEIREVEAAMAEIERCRAEVAAAEAELTKRQVSPADAQRIDELHAEVSDAEDRAERRLAPPSARRRLQQAREAEVTFLRGLGFSSYTDYLISTTTLLADPSVPQRAAAARARLATAEAAWRTLTGADERAAREAAEDREAELLRRARDLLGALPHDGIEDALRALRVTSEPLDLGPLEAALAEVGAFDGSSPMAAAERFLVSADEAHARRAALQAELTAVSADLEDVTAALDALGPMPATSQSELDAARAELHAATAAEQHALRAVVAAREGVADHRSRLQRIEALRDDVAGAVAAEQQSTARVDELEGHVAQLEAAIERRRRSRHDAVARSDVTIDLGDVDRDATAVYLLSRVAAQRDVADVGSLPLVLSDVLDGLSPETTQVVLDVIERLAPSVQMVLMSDDPAIEEWVRSFGDDAAIRRFSWATREAHAEH